MWVLVYIEVFYGCQLSIRRSYVGVDESGSTQNLYITPVHNESVMLK